MRAAGPRSQPPRIMQDDYWHYTSVGNLGMTVTNFGILGQGYNNPDQPSCEYKFRSTLDSRKDEVEHFSYAGIWVGGIDPDGREKVSTAITDGVFGYEDGGWEYTSSFADSIADTPIWRHLAEIDRRFDLSRIDEGEIEFANALTAQIVDSKIYFGEGDVGVDYRANSAWDTVVTQSSLRETSPGNPYGSQFDPAAISHQDLICAYTDTNVHVPGTGVSIPNHDPLGVHVYQETYAWNFGFADAFSILNYTITNVPRGWIIAEADTTVDYGLGVVREFSAGDTIFTGPVIEAPYFGLWIDSSIGNMNYTSNYGENTPGGRWNWYDNLNDYVPERHLALQYDFDGDDGWAQSYLGVKALGAEMVEGDSLPDDWDAYYHQWTWQGSTFGNDFPMPATESDRYRTMKTHGNYAAIPHDSGHQQSWMIFLSCGPFPDLAPGDRFNVVYAIVCARWNGGGQDSEQRRRNLYTNADWAQIAYNGEDRNGNGVLDPGEDRDGDGEITRYILPEPPPSPELAVVAGDHRVELYWTDDPEAAIDPISGEQDFEGYKVYGSPKTKIEDPASEQEFTLLAEFDVDTTETDTNLVGFNLGLDAARLEQDTVIGGVTYQYGWVNEGVTNGWPRDLYYAVTSYDHGDPDAGLQSLESNAKTNLTYAFPGTLPADPGDRRVGVYPNPYRGRAAWDGFTGRDRLIWFRNLPARCEVTIFTLAGEQVDSFEHNAATYDGGDVQRIEIGATANERRAFSGGEHAWDLLSDDEQEIATGLYIYTVENLGTGDVKTGKFLVIK
ncbi:MAG: hypothetical protein MAG453_01949 [Calditrichaeota bacterium]|nr:hypothetical protein [Calditrichota bacterium]